MNKNNDADLIPLKITINCTNDIAFMDCAYLLDKPEFLRLLPDLRKKYGLQELIPYKDFYRWKEEKLRDDLKLMSSNNMETVTKLIQKAEHGATTQELFDMQHFSRQFEWEAEFLCRKFKRPGYFSLIIQYAIACGEVGNESYQSTYIEVSPSELPVDDMPLPEVRIVITPMSKPEDVEEVFRKNVPQIFESNKKFLKYYFKMKNKKIPNIRRDREWYWENLMGKMPRYIYANTPLIADDEFNVGSVAKAIERYRDNLHSY